MCGLVGFYPKKNKKVELSVLAILGIGNEERGTDNAGICIGKDVFIKSQKDNKIKDLLFNNLEEITSYLKSEDALNKPVILHARKSSIHNKTKAEHAHPFGWKAEDLSTYFYGAHNGNVKELYDLYSKYRKSDDVKFIDYDIDSELLLDCIRTSLIKTGSFTDVLSTYEGHAALLFYNENRFYAWKGANNNIEERPLYYVETDGGFYFSSIESLLKIAFPSKDVISLNNNELLTFEKGKLATSEIIDRKIVSKTPAYANSWDDYGTYTYKQSYVYPKTPVQVIHVKVNSDLLYGHKVNGNFELLDGDYYSYKTLFSKDISKLALSESAYYNVKISFNKGILLSPKTDINNIPLLEDIHKSDNITKLLNKISVYHTNISDILHNYLYIPKLKGILYKSFHITDNVVAGNIHFVDTGSRMFPKINSMINDGTIDTNKFLKSKL